MSSNKKNNNKNENINEKANDKIKLNDGKVNDKKKNDKLKIVILLIAFVLFMAGSTFLYNNLQRNKSAENENVANENELKAPDFTVYDLDGNPTQLSELEGKPVVLNFWASWCPPCKAEMPYFDNAYKEIGDDVHFLMVDLVDGFNETVATGSRYIEQEGYTFPVYFDTEGEAGYAYGVRAIPMTLFIDKDGYIITSVHGMIEEETLRENIEMIRN